MSSYQREPMTGLIRQDNRVVGTICLPEEDPQEFIDDFNNCYGPLRLHIEPVQIPGGPPVPVRPVRPVGAVYRRG
ncbi:MAG: hypothetical protein IT423_04740 [Pirellulaceae bacterium]|nr:hypothetical protein [Pirellulaceae bacterium]